MKRLLFVSSMLTIAGVAYYLLAAGTTVYVDATCPTAGNGTGGYTITCDATAAGNPARTIAAGVTAMVAGDTLNIRGIHSAHDSCPGDTIGRYYQNEVPVTTVCSSGSPCVIQSNGWTAIGTGERVYLEGDRCANNASGSCNSAWTRCTWSGAACNAPCAGVGGGGQTACEATWYVTDNGTAPTTCTDRPCGIGSAAAVRWAVKDDGSPTYRVASLAAMTNASGSYKSKRCNTDTWRPCDVTADCPVSQTCTGKSDEIDSYSDGTTLFVRWGSTLPTRPYVSYTGAGDAFAFKASGPAAYWTVRGITMRNHRVSAVFADPGTNNLTFNDVVVFYTIGPSGGSSRSFDLNAAGPVSITNSEMALSFDEAAHVIGKAASAATDVDISNCWIHLNGRDSEVGPESGAPSGLTYGDDAANAATGNFTGSIIDGNLIEKLEQSAGSPGYGLRWEHSVSNTIIRNNIIHDTENAPCLVLDGSSGIGGTPWQTDNNEVYNNLMYNCGNNGINIYCGSGADRTVRDNKIYNNTIANATNREFNLEVGNGTCTGNLFRNNIAYDSGANQVVALGFSGTTNKWQNNLTYSTAGGTVVAFAGKNSTCAQIVVGADVDNDTVVNDNDKCADPAFINSSAAEFHLISGSQAIDAGTSTGMPASRTTDINNTIAVNHGLPVYSDANPIQNLIWDIGIDEFPFSGGGGLPTLDIAVTDAPDPVAAGANITYTLTYHNTGSASASNVVIVDYLPANTTYSSCSGGVGCAFFPGGGTHGSIAWDIGTVLASGSGSVTFVATVNQVGGGTIIRNDTYAITSDETGSVLGAVATTTVSNANSRRGRIFPGGRK